MTKDSVPNPFSQALRQDAATLESHAADAAKMAIDWAGQLPGEPHAGVDVMLKLVDSMRDTAATLRTGADFLDAAVAGAPGGTGGADPGADPAIWKS